jgi:hypothetical protein
MATYEVKIMKHFNKIKKNMAIFLHLGVAMCYFFSIPYWVIGIFYIAQAYLEYKYE